MSGRRYLTRGRALALMVCAMLIVLGSWLGAFVGVEQAHAQLSVGQVHLGGLASVSPAAQPSGHVTIIVLDMSGSMSSNDPNGIRCSASNAYIDLSSIGDFIGVVGLDNSNGAHGGTPDFQQAQVWAEPSEMATTSQRKGLEQAIKTKSRSCAPNGNTPTYDALRQSLLMLQTATQGGQISGSVILLTDGVPAPDTDQQIAAIKADLVPQFQQHNWPVDTIALGKDQDFSFLNDIANGTSGKAYNDAKGVVENGGNPSPLNIAPFFVDIFAQRNHRTPGPDVAPTAINGGSTSRDFQIGDYVDHLDVVAIKDQPNTQITLISPDGQRIQESTAGASTLSDLYDHYMIFSINGPQPGYWTFTIKGNGSFLMDSLVTSSLSVSILSPAENAPAMPLGEDVTIKAAVQDHGSQVTNLDATVSATITFVGDLPFGATAPQQTVVLSDKNTPGTYQGKVNIAEDAPPGSYEIRVAVKQGTGVSITEDSRIVRLELFPGPCLGPCGSSPQPQVVEWDPVTRAIYGLPVGVIDWLSHWPLGGLPARTEAHLAGTIYLKGAVYPNATVKVSATRHDDASKKDVATPVSWVNDGQGSFHVVLPYTGPGVYTLTFQTQGSFQDSHGDFGQTTVMVHPHLQAATYTQELQDGAISLFYALLLVFIILCIRFGILPKPFGGLQEQPAVNNEEYEDFRRAKRSLWRRFIHPNMIWGDEMMLEPEIVFRFTGGRDRTIQAKNETRYLLEQDKMPRGWPRVDGSKITEPGKQARTFLVIGDADSPPETSSAEPGYGNEPEGERKHGLHLFGGITIRLPQRRSGADDGNYGNYGDGSDYGNDNYSGDDSYDSGDYEGYGGYGGYDSASTARSRSRRRKNIRR